MTKRRLDAPVVGHLGRAARNRSWMSGLSVRASALAATHLVAAWSLVGILGPHAYRGRSRRVSDAAVAAEGVEMTVSGFVVAEGDVAYICEELAESFPPQTAGARLPIEGLPPAIWTSLSGQGPIRWSDRPVTLRVRRAADSLLALG